jgi:hypothetical protein
MMHLAKHTKDLKQVIFYSNTARENGFYHVYVDVMASRVSFK